MAIPTWPKPKDPDEVLDYKIDWNLRTGADVIVSSDWTVPSGLVEDSSSQAAGFTTVWLSGGTLGETYTLHNRIVTQAGRTMDQSVKLKVRLK